MELIDRLAEHKTLQGAPREELKWLIEHGSVLTFEADEVITRKGSIAPSMSVILSGMMAMYVDRGAGPDKIVEWQDGDVTGVLPYSRLVGPPGNVIALTRVEILAVPREQMQDLIRACYCITGTLVHTMLDRARLFTSTELQNEKMISLGKLSAGLAHELNNPASAIERCASQLEDRLEDLGAATQAMGQAKLGEAESAAAAALRTACRAQPASALSPLQQADREDAIADWLTERKLDCRLACSLADTGVSLEGLEELASVISLDSSGMDVVLRSAAAECSVRGLTSQIQDAAMRISSLVAAVKGFTHMDQAMAAQPVDLKHSLENTVAVLRAKARAKSIEVAVEVPEGLPRVCGFAAELSQIWGNLIDNALDAVEAGGRVVVSASQAGERMEVCVADNGPGISTKLMARIFEPFFTTKPQGEGTGLGLDIARRLVKHNNGAIEVSSQPGNTEFRVLLPPA